MKVRATMLGYYNHVRVKPGTVFKLNKEIDFSSVWMEQIDAKVETEEEAAGPKKKKAKKDEEPLFPSDDVL